MKRTRFLSAAIAATLAVSALTTSAFADDPSTVLNGVTKIPVLDVTVPTDDGFFINPYGMDLSSLGVPEDNKSDKVIPGYLITTPAATSWVITNNSTTTKVVAKMYAVVTEVGNVQVNATAGNGFNSGSVDDSKNQLTLNLKEYLGPTTGEAKNFTLLNAAPDWDATTGVITDTLETKGTADDKNKINITLDGDCTPCSAGWTADDSASIKISYHFGF